jgi:hypothetical protein
MSLIVDMGNMSQATVKTAWHIPRGQQQCPSVLFEDRPGMCHGIFFALYPYAQAERSCSKGAKIKNYNVTLKTKDGKRNR